ncbi:hypothetical protein ACLIA0_06310 [Bacillaceae bacterium W0354]
MKYILCQPAILRFKWELEICITRLQKLGIRDIVLLFTRQDDRVPHFFSDYYSVETHVYEDHRTDKTYIPSVKPYLWMRYLEEDPSRQNNIYFYLDSDVLLRDIPNITPTETTWYTSDCQGYIGNDYIDSKGDKLLENMCYAIGIDHELIRSKKPTGGAQWAIKNPTYEYWKKVYEDSITLYKLLSNSNTDIQAWTAEMWAQLWNVYHFGIDIEVPSELDFSWPIDPVERYYKTKIYHNAGVVDDHQNLFFKGKYVNHTPFEDDLSFVNKNKASIKYVEAIKEVRQMAKYVVLEDFRDLEEEKNYKKGDSFPKPKNKKISEKRLKELSSKNNKMGRPMIKKVESDK